MADAPLLPPRPFRPSLRLAAVILLTLVVGAAAGGAPAQGLEASIPPVAPPAPGASAAIARADALFFANHYDAAEQAYKAAVGAQPENPVAHAGLALFLNYRQDFQQARQQARAATDAGPASGRAWAVRCRVEDWSLHIDDAVTAGRRAVTLAGEDPIAHLFYAEALSDKGRAAEGKAEIASAARLIGADSSAYERAELRREEGNLARDQGNAAGELAAFQAAFDAQPSWVERPSELASAYLDNDNLDGARSALGKALALAPSDAALLASLGRISLLQSDYSSAETAFQGLLGLRPHDPAVLSLAAEVAMAAHHDSDRARSLLRQALTVDPSNAVAAAYLLNLDRDVVGDEQLGRTEVAEAIAAASPDDSTVPGRPRARVRSTDPDSLLAARQAKALAAVNKARSQAGLAPVRLDPRLSASALAHSYYWLFNNGAPAVAKLGIHRETLGQPGFAGVRPSDRAATFGYRDGPVGEDITHRGDPEGAVADWVNSVYHRFPILRPDLQVIGYGDASIGPLPIEDMEFGFGYPNGPHHDPVLFPAAGQTEVATSFSDNELPDPVPAGAPRTTGYPVTVTFDPYAQALVAHFTLAGPDGVVLGSYVLEPGPDTENSASLLPVAPLRPHTVYTAHLIGTLDDRALDRTWTFTTAAS